MVSEKQPKANRQNARKSTVPRSAEGKFRASRNAGKHGLTAESVVLPNEDPAEYEARVQEWLGDLTLRKPHARPPPGHARLQTRRQSRTHRPQRAGLSSNARPRGSRTR